MKIQKVRYKKQCFVKRNVKRHNGGLMKEHLSEASGEKAIKLIAGKGENSI